MNIFEKINETVNRVVPNYFDKTQADLNIEQTTNQQRLGGIGQKNFRDRSKNSGGDWWNG